MTTTATTTSWTLLNTRITLFNINYQRLRLLIAMCQSLNRVVGPWCVVQKNQVKSKLRVETSIKPHVRCSSIPPTWDWVPSLDPMFWFGGKAQTWGWGLILELGIKNSAWAQASKLNWPNRECYWKYSTKVVFLWDSCLLCPLWEKKPFNTTNLVPVP